MLHLCIGTSEKVSKFRYKTYSYLLASIKIEQTLSNYSGPLTEQSKLRSILSEFSCNILMPWSERRLTVEWRLESLSVRTKIRSITIFIFISAFKSNVVRHKHNLIWHPAFRKAVYDCIRLPEWEKTSGLYRYFLYCLLQYRRITTFSKTDRLRQSPICSQNLPDTHYRQEERNPCWHWCIKCLITLSRWTLKNRLILKLQHIICIPLNIDL